MVNSINLSNQCLTFPELQSPQISRRNIIDWLLDRFTTERKVIIVQGVDGAGKTTLLAQFAKTIPERCICFFAKQDIWSLDPQRFLEELCEQMFLAIHGREEVLNLPKDYYQLKQYFNSLYSQIAKKGRNQQKPYFFVIDGLEWVARTYGQESIIELLPSDPLNGTFLLASSSKDQEFKFFHEKISIEFFGPTEVTAYLHDIGIDDKTAINSIYDVCKGMPGYLDQLRRELVSGIPYQEVIYNLPKGFLDLLERDWERITKSDKCVLDAIAISTYSELPLSIDELSIIVGVENADLRNCLDAISYLRFNKTGLLSFVTDAHRKFIAEKLSNKKIWAVNALINFYENNPSIENAQSQLPVLYRSADRYDALKSLVGVNNLTNLFKSKHDLLQLRRSLKLASDAAFEKKEWQFLTIYSLLGATFQSISTDSPLESEVRAFLALGDYQQAIGMAYQAVLPEDRLHLFTEVCNKIREESGEVPKEVLSEIDNLISFITPSANTKDLLIKIAANLFYIHSQAAIDLVDKISRLASSGRSVDILLSALSVKLEEETQEHDSAAIQENIRAKIDNQSLQQFVRVSSPLNSKLTPEQIIDEVEDIKDMAAKILMLRSWCNANRKNPNSYIVVEKALSLMTASPFSPSMRQLRQFAEPLRAVKWENTYQLIGRFDLLKDTAIKKPEEEVIRLELLLATLEAKKMRDIAYQRLLNVYVELDKISDLDTLCFIYVQILLHLPEIDNTDPLRIKVEIEDKLPKAYTELLRNTADHFIIARKIIRSLSNYDPKTAIVYAEKLNSLSRRDQAYSEILRIYSRNPSTIDFTFLNNTLSKIADKSQRDNVVVSLTHRFSENFTSDLIQKASHFFDQIKTLDDPEDKSIAYAYYLLVIKKGNQGKLAETLFDRCLKAWQEIDSLWAKVDTGFKITTILAVLAPDKASQILKLTRDEKQANPLSNGTIAEEYINTTKLAIRTFSDIVKAKDYQIYCSKLIEAIDQIPSLEIRSLLFADLALRHLLAEKILDFRSIMKDRVFKIIDFCKDKEFNQIRRNIITHISPCLYEYDQSNFRYELDQLDNITKNQTLIRLIIYLISNRSISDPVDLEIISATKRIEFPLAFKICEILESMTTDIAIYPSFQNLISLIVKPNPRSPENLICTLNERHAIKIADTLIKNVISKLPDIENITHDGYKVVCLAQLAKLRKSIADRALNQWQLLIPSWSVLANMARNIPNTADRILVMTSVAEAMFSSDLSLASTLLKEAGDLINAIPCVIDRGSRFETIARTWKNLKDDKTAMYFLKEAMSVLKGLDWSQTRDQLTGMILQQAHSINPEFAASLTSMVDNPVIEHEVENYLTIQDLRDHPDRILPQTNDLDELLHIRSRAAQTLLQGLCSGKNTSLQSSEKISTWINDAFEGRFQEAYYITAWSVENNILQNRQMSSSVLHDTFNGLIDNVHMIWITGNIISGSHNMTSDLLQSNPSIPESLQIYRVGSAEEAFNSLRNWLDKNVAGYVKVYDAFFTPSDLEVLCGIPTETRVHIITQRKSQVDKQDDEKVISSYKTKFNEFFTMENCEIRFHIFGTKSNGDGPIHDRFYITSGGKGLQIGTSTSGLGNKDSIIRSMSNEETLAIEANIVDKMLFTPPFHYKNERLYLISFTLDK